LKPTQLRHRDSPGRAKRKRQQRRQSDHQHQRVRPEPSRSAVLHLPRNQLPPQQIERDQPDGRRADHPEIILLDRDRRQHQAAIGEKNALDRLPRVARRRKALHYHVPEQQLQQQRQVAQQLDIDRGEPRQQPVGGQPRDADQRPHHRR
jgi:hypothetical protein